MTRTWRDSAACGPENARIFDPVDLGHTDKERRASRNRVAQARRICSTCTVTAECAEYGVRERLSGIYAGLVLEDGGAKQI